VRRWPIGLVAPLMALVLNTGPAARADTAASPSPELSPLPTETRSVPDMEAALLARLDAERAAAGLPALAVQPWARSVARQHSRDMAAARDIWHNHAGYLDVARQAMGAYLSGENVAEAGTLDEADGLLTTSAPHRANILYPAFNSVGIGVATDAAGYVYVTQDFADILPAPAAPSAPLPAQGAGPTGGRQATAASRPARPAAAAGPTRAPQPAEAPAPAPHAAAATQPAIPQVVEEVASQPPPTPAAGPGPRASPPSVGPSPAANVTRPPGDAFGWLVAALVAPGLLVPLRLRRRPPRGR
jgi:uncharacterized protein YkwD